MKRPEYILPPTQPGGYSQAVKIGDRVETSGQGGWTDAGEYPPALEDEIAQAFDNLEHVLGVAGAAWDHVISVDSYHLLLNTDVYAMLVQQLHFRMPRHAPIWTCISVPHFGNPGMRVEIRVTAIIVSSDE